MWYGTDRKKRQPRKLTVIEIKDLEKEYLLVLARLQLLRVDADPSQGIGMYIDGTILTTEVAPGKYFTTLISLLL